MGTEVPKTQDSSGDSDSNSDSENSSSSDTSGSDWECSGSKQSSARKPHFSVTSCDTGLKLKIAAIPRKVTPTKPAKPSVKKKTIEGTSKTPKDVKKKVSESSSSSESCSKCSSDSSSEDDLPLKTVKKNLPAKCSPQKTTVKTARNSIKSDSDEELCMAKENAKCKEKPCASKANASVKKTKCDESSNDSNAKKGPARQRTKEILGSISAMPWAIWELTNSELLLAVASYHPIDKDMPRSGLGFRYDAALKWSVATRAPTGFTSGCKEKFIFTRIPLGLGWD
ncbi:jg14753 [Pararge aegeria aegeria]|uniref:Jg14753 protein n=1 Tax=Pararge aegeria aegeria TaxID=348720 RepID=A0A8S4SKR4_9NEOP|nr:jg14753 [Pararge aegeria aegeria]